MANRNPWQARLAKALKAKPLTLDDVLRLDGYVLGLAFVNVVRARDPELQRVHILAYCTISGKLAKQIEAMQALEFDARLSALEASIRERNGHVA